MNNTQNKIGVIILNYNNYPDTLVAINSVKRQITNSSIQIYLVDNGSDDDSLKYLSKIKKIKFIKSSKNLGFAGGNNLAIKKAIKDKCSQILLLNNDAKFISKYTLQNLVDNNKGLIAPIIKFKRDDEIIYDYGGKVDRVFGRNTHYESTFIIEGLIPSADYYSGACLLIKSEVVKKIGLLDDHFFLYYEDADYCLRANKLNIPVELLSSQFISHKLSASTSKLKSKKISILAKSHFLFCLKHLPPVSTPFFIAFNLYLRLKTL